MNRGSLTIKSTNQIGNIILSFFIMLKENLKGHGVKLKDDHLKTKEKYRFFNMRNEMFPVT